MGWQDAPIVEKAGGGGWQDAPLVNPPEVLTNTPPEVEKGLLARIGDDVSSRVAKVKAGAPKGTGVLDEYLYNPLINTFNAGGQAVNALGDVALETGKSVYNVLMPQAGKDLNKAVGESVANSFSPGTVEAAKAVPGTWNELARTHPEITTALDSAGGWVMAGPMLKGAKAVGGEVANIGKDAVAGAVPRSALVNSAQSSLQMGTTAIKPAKQLAMGEALLESGLKPTDWKKLEARSKELSAATRAEIAPVAQEPIDLAFIPEKLRDSEYLSSFKTTQGSQTAQGLTGQAVQPLKLTVGEAQRLKQTIDADLLSHYKKEMRGVPSWTNEQYQAAKELRTGLQKSIEAQAPGVVPLNAENSKLLRLQPSVDKVGNAAMDARTIEHPYKMGMNALKGAETSVVQKIYNAQKAGPQSMVGKKLNSLAPRQ